MEKADLAELLKIRNVCHALSSRYKETTEEIKILTENDDDELDFYAVRDSINDLLDITALIYQSTDMLKDYIKNHIFEGDLLCSTVHNMEFDILNHKVSESLEQNKIMFNDILDNIQNRISDEYDEYNE